ncbi:Inositol-pentakisphosphate 2-kinase [Rhizophlyctis rosea]|nr:Inositol-pentakisphosphate 2-kinase [Rhizophlyctis rosea]
MTQEVAALIPDHTIMQEALAKVALSQSPPLSPSIGSFAIELKPKWGFLPDPSAISPSTQIKLRTCRYCMHQQYKARKDDSHTVSNFCPLDVYSGDSTRVKAAFEELCSNPQNNLRFFVDGAPCGVQDDVTRTRLDEFISGGFDNLLTLISKVFAEDPLLRVLKTRQQSLDAYDIEWIYRWYQSLVENGKTPSDTDEQEWEEAVRRFLDEGGGAVISWILESDCLIDALALVGPKRSAEETGVPEIVADASSEAGITSLQSSKRKRKEGSLSDDDEKSEPESKRKRRKVVADSDPFQMDISDEEKLLRIRLFMLSVTLKDVSVILTFAKDSSLESHEDEAAPHLGNPMGKVRVADQAFTYKLRVVDIDPKRVSKIPHYWKLDQDIVSHSKSLKCEKQCNP